MCSAHNADLLSVAQALVPVLTLTAKAQNGHKGLSYRGPLNNSEPGENRSLCPFGSPVERALTAYDVRTAVSPATRAWGKNGAGFPTADARGLFCFARYAGSRLPSFASGSDKSEMPTAVAGCCPRIRKKAHNRCSLFCVSMED